MTQKRLANGTPAPTVIQLVWLRGLLQLARPPRVCSEPWVDNLLLVRSPGRRHVLYIPDGVNHPLCEYCLWNRWEPPQPDARTRLYEALQEILPILPERALQEIAEFCHDWHEP